ncbi:MAG TPA: hypothetical protein DEB06_09585, partial [Phycisphaerales bacterium]|nr:hypothetical protein [Phycisphaerales bacterium]
GVTLTDESYLLADIASRQLRVRPESALPEVVVGAQLPPTGESVAGFLKEGGLAARQLPNGGVEAWYLFGGVVGGNPPVQSFNELYRATFPSNLAGEPQWALVRDFSAGGQSEAEFNSLYFHGLAWFDVGDGFPLYASFEGVSGGDATTASRLMAISPTTGQTRDIMDFTVPLEGGLASSHERGSVFVVADAGLQSRDASVLEFDPRNNYLKNAWTSSSGALGAAPETQFGSGTDASFLNNVFQTEGLSFAKGKLTLAGRTVDSQAQLASALVTFNPSATGSAGSPRVERVERTAGQVVGLSEVTSGSPAPASVLANPAGGVDTTSINTLFAQLAYSQQALDSGFVREVFSRHFFDTSIDPAGCAASTLAQRIPDVLQQFVNTQAGIGRAAFELRHVSGQPIAPNHPCFPADFAARTPPRNP